jgi:YidC/Oxa1 family membrane protein insertase
MEERRLLLAVALSLLVLTAYSLLFAPASPPSALPAPAPSPTAVAAAAPARAPAAGPAEAPEAKAPATAQADDRERRVEVQAVDYAVAFTNRGARLVSWTLSRYRDARGRPEEMIPTQGAGVRPLDVETGDAALDARLREALFKPTADTVTVSGAEPHALRFAFSDGEVEAEKTLVFRASGLVAVA